MTTSRKRTPSKLSQDDLEQLAFLLKEDKTEDKDTAGTNLIKIITGIIGTLVTAALIFVASNTYNTNTQLVQMTASVGYVGSTVADLKKKVEDMQATYATQAMVNEVKVQDKARSDDLDTRVRAIELNRKK